MMTRLAIYAAMIGGVLLAVWLAYNHYTGLLETIQKQNEAITQYENIVAQKEQEIGTLRRSIDNIRRAQKETQDRLAKARETSERLKNVFVGHDFGKLVQEKPGLVEKRINNATRSVIERRTELAR